MTADERIAWIDAAKGICIMAVVSVYAVDWVAKLPARPAGPESAMEAWVRFARPFRMPDFFLLSGLFLGRVIDRPWRGYLDKKALHYLYFFLLWTFIDFPFVLLAGKGGRTPAEAAAHLRDMLFYDPYATLWFIQMLTIYFLLARLLRAVPAGFVLPLAVLWQTLPFATGVPQLDRVGQRFVFFYAGYAFAPAWFRLARWARARPAPALAGLAAWAAVNGLAVNLGMSAMPGVSAALGLLGAGAVIAAASVLSGLPFMGWLSRVGERSIVIYLAFLLPMTALLLAVSRLGWTWGRGSLAAALAAAGVLGPLLFERAARRTPLRFLFERPGWAKLPAGPL